MSQGLIFSGGLRTGADWFEDFARRQQAQRFFEEQQALRAQADADYAAYRQGVLENQQAEMLQRQQAADAKAAQLLAERQAAAAFTGTMTGREVDPNVPYSMQGQAIGEAVAGRKADALQVIKDRVKAEKLGYLGKAIPAFINDLGRRAPNDPVRGPMVSKLMDLIGQATVLGMDPDQLAGAIPAMPAAQPRGGDTENAVLRARADLIKATTDGDDPELIDIKRQLLDKAMRLHAIRTTGNAPESFYGDREGTLRRMPVEDQRASVPNNPRFAFNTKAADDAAWAAYQRYGSGAAEPAPPAVQQPPGGGQIDVTPEEVDAIKRLREQGMDLQTAIQTVKRGQP